MKLRDGILLVVLVLLFVILAYLVSSKNPKQSFLNRQGEIKRISYSITEEWLW